MLWVVAWSAKNKLVEDNWDAACLQECGELGAGLGKQLLVSGEGARAPAVVLHEKWNGCAACWIAASTNFAISRGNTFLFGRRVERDNVAEFQLKSAMHLQRRFAL